MMTQNDITQWNEICDKNMADTQEGPWKHEPHRVEFKHAGFDCLAVRHGVSLHWCGYVGVPAGHPFHGKGYDDVSVEVHGGLTYSDACKAPVCHITESGDTIHWFGFDCAHGGDFSPSYTKEPMLAIRAESYRRFPGIKDNDTYKTIEYVKAEICELAEQLRKAA